MAKTQYSPGERVPDSGICEAVGPRGGSKVYETTVEEGEVFPPTKEPGDRWVYVRKTRH